MSKRQPYRAAKIDGAGTKIHAREADLPGVVCGADLSTGRGRRSSTRTTEPVDCKRCLAWVAKQEQARAAKPRTVHLDAGGERAACGMTLCRLTSDPEQVTCRRCAPPEVAQARQEAKQRAAMTLTAQDVLVALAAGPLHQCECSRYFYVAEGVTYTTECAQAPRSRKGRFAQGHDAKLTSLAKRAQAAGAELRGVAQ